jgi:glyoxylase-like metal-dependent hydrolase (beta-lactamase superfamily II)/8-oxo-dGTP pyrophosphatase MutT (NUDIX family)
MTRTDRSWMAGYEPPPDARLAASVLFLRDGAAGLEVLMLQRAERDGDPRSGVMVFPGGVVEASDAAAGALCLGDDDAAWSQRLGMSRGGQAFAVAAVREAYEEVGLLLAASTDGATSGVAAQAQALEAWRPRLNAGEVSLAAFCEAHSLRPDLRGLAYAAHWITPPGMPRRFDTRFFWVLAPQGQGAQADQGEAVALAWLTPAEALSPERGLKLLPVTRRVLQELARFPDAAAAWTHARDRREVPLTMPRVGRTGRGPRVVLPDELPWAEIGRLDPEGRGDVLAELVPGVAVALSPRVLRVTAPNPGPMTGPGTNTYLVRDADRPGPPRWTIIDPGPDHPAHVQRLLEVAAADGGVIERILVTHTHRDHSPAAAPLAAATGAPCWGLTTAVGMGQDATFVPDHRPSDLERLVLGPGTTLQALHTPGHASNHVCWLLEEERLLFTGDHVMQGSTVVINPPDGDMVAYLKALERLLSLPLEWLAPGHGFLVARPHDVVRGLVAHRLRREDKVARALDAAGPVTLSALVPRVYDDVPAALHGVAARSLLAHLLKLQHDGRAVCTEGAGEQGPWQSRVGT